MIFFNRIHIQPNWLFRSVTLLASLALIICSSFIDDSEPTAAYIHKDTLSRSVHSLLSFVLVERVLRGCHSRAVYVG